MAAAEGVVTKELIVGEGGAGSRLDVFLSEQEIGPSRSYVRKLIDAGRVMVNGVRQSKAGAKVSAGDRVKVEIPPPRRLEVIPEPIPIDIVYEDRDIVVVNKPVGLVVHPAPGHERGTLVNALLYHCQDLSGIGGKIRPGIVHRLDKDTTGLMVVAKNDKAHLHLARQIKERSARREYLALVHDNIKVDRGTVNAPIGRHPVDRKRMAVNVQNGRRAVTHFRVLRRFGDYCLIRCRLETGRTHQIRVHMAYVGHPVLGDPVYGPKRHDFRLPGQMLHAFLLCFQHPETRKEMSFSASLPDVFRSVLDKLREGIDKPGL